jgi:hypothetical protein
MDLYLYLNCTTSFLPQTNLGGMHPFVLRSGHHIFIFNLPMRDKCQVRYQHLQLLWGA